MIDLNIYSPVEEIHDSLFEEKKIRLFIKRDDLIHPFISGNKWRKLKYLLLKAQHQNKKHLVTFGGAWSNHLLATAAAGAKFGFKTTGIVRGEAVNNQLLTLCKLFGMYLHFADRESYRDKPLLYKGLFSNDTDSFFIDEGGASPEAIQGCAELVTELEDKYDHIFCACGTGTTAAGIAMGIIQNQLHSKLNVVPVLKDNAYLKQEILNYLPEHSTINFHPDYHFGGYAKTSAGLISFIKTFASKTGILLDPIYTGKLLFAIYHLTETNFFEPNSKILVIHTGGLFGLLGKIELF